MGQSHDCLHSDLYQSKRHGLDMSRRLSDSRKSARRPRLRNAFSTSTAVEKDLPYDTIGDRRLSEPCFAENPSNCGSIQRGISPLQKASSIDAGRKGTFLVQSKRSIRRFWSARSFRLRKPDERTNSPDLSKPDPKLRKRRNSSFTLSVASMAHHKLRAGASPSPRRAADQKSLNGDSPSQQSTQDTENYQPASVESLARRCAASFDESGDCKDEEFPRLLFLTHPWFMTSEQLVALFTQMFEDEDTTLSVKTQVLQAIRYWMKEFPHVFDLNSALVEAIKNLQTQAAGDANLDATLIDLSNRGNYRWMRTDRLSLRPAAGAARKSRKVSLVFHHLEPEELAIHISYLEFKCFRRLTFEDFHNYAVRATIKSIARLERFVFLFNNITLWVQCMVLGQHTPQERAGVITKYIKIAQKLHEMRSYNALMAVVGGLTHTAIARLKKTMSALSRDSIKALDELVDILDSRFNYIAYRRDYANEEGVFKIPIIGVHLKDIISLHTALLDRDGDGLINVKKMVTIGSIFQEFLNLQRLSYPHEVNKDLLNTLRVSLYLYYTEEEIYALSLQREPRDTKNSVSGMNSPSKATCMVFSEFTKFTCQLDNKTVKQHVKAMVESVFKAYDHDSDGFISEEEFVSFKDNFPMMESFSAMDVDRDGKISRDEMCEYFMKASAGKRNDFCQNFTHEFTETTYFHPTFCEECQKLLWGLVKQGWKCKGCGINCHKHCKDRIVQECRPKQANHQVNSLKSNGSRQQKSSVSSESDVSANGDAVPATGNLSVQAQQLDDETFDSGPGELSQFKTSPLVMRRTASLASSDGTFRSKYNRNSDCKTPPLPRKYQEGGRKSFQDKMLRIIPRRSNSNKIRVTTEVSTQTLPNTLPQLTPSYPVKKSFLYPKAPSSPKLLPSNEKPVKQRLGSCGEELDEVNAQANLNTEQSENDTKLLHARNYRHDTLSSTFSNNSARYPSVRRDSGLSGCFVPASCDNSLPVTPDFHTRLGNQLSSTFKFPTNFVYDDLNGSTSEPMNNLTQENHQLHQTNAILTKEITSLKEYVDKLETLLKDSGLDCPKIE